MLQMATHRVAADWTERYAVKPLAVYSHVGAQYSGYSYHCAGWHHVGKTQRRRSPQAGAVWCFALEAGWRERLHAVDDRPIGTLAGAYDGLDMDWAEREYGRCSHTDGRVRRRIVRMGRAWFHNMGVDLPVIFPQVAEQRAVYRFFSSPRISMSHILDPHVEATVDRCRQEPLILAIQDTTSINDTGLKGTTGLARLGGGGEGSLGVLAHAGLAVTGDGRPLGLFMLDTTFREKTAEQDSKRWVHGLIRASELAKACPNTRVVSVCDREGDFWELLTKAASLESALLVRASRSAQQRVLLPDGQEQDLWDYDTTLAPVAITELTIPAAGGPRARKERTAQLELRTSPVDVRPPQAAKHQQPLSLFAVSATEVDVAEKDKPLHWLLLTTEQPAPDEAPAMFATTLLDWYRKRWTIETWFKTLKTGTRMKDRRLDTASDLQKCRAFDAVTACRVADITERAREHPELPATDMYSRVDIELLHTLLKHQGHRNLLEKSVYHKIGMQTCVMDIGRLVGSHPSTRQLLPGAQKVWQGLERLNGAIEVRDAIDENPDE